MKKLSLPIVGSYYRPPAKLILKCLPGGAELNLRKEPDNPHDPNAISVWVESKVIPQSQDHLLNFEGPNFGFDAQSIRRHPEWHLGFVSRDAAAEQGPHLPASFTGSLGFDLSGKPTVIVQLP